MYLKIFFRLSVFIISFYLLTFFVSQTLKISISDIEIFVSSFGIYAPIFYSFLYLLGLTIPFNPVSEFLLINVASLSFPTHTAIIFTFITHCLALTINYFIGKKFGKKILNFIVKEENYKYIDKYLKKLTIKNLFIIRFFIPISSVVGADIVSYVAGIERLPFLKYFLASIIPWTIVNIAYFTSTAYLSEKSIYFYFLPVIIIVGIPFILLFLFKKLQK